MVSKIDYATQNDGCHIVDNLNSLRNRLTMISRRFCQRKTDKISLHGKTANAITDSSGFYQSSFTVSMPNGTCKLQSISSAPAANYLIAEEQKRFLEECQEPDIANAHPDFSR